PVLGICLGMQLLFGDSEEGGRGLGLLGGHVVRLRARQVPHMGWNTLAVSSSDVLEGLDGLDVYFAHSFAAADAEGVVATVDHDNGRVVKGVRFETLREVGDPVELATRYSELGADELVFLDVTATVEGRRPPVELVERAAEALEIPFTVGGGVATLEDARALLRAGADKVAVNRAALEQPELVGELAGEFGAQAVVCEIDARAGAVVTHGGRQ